MTVHPRRRRLPRSWRKSLVVVALAAIAAVSACVPANTEREAHFAARGTWAVTTTTASAPGTPGVSLYYPTNLGANGYRHPIITWANGTGATCEATDQHSGMLTHLASWGFAVVCARSGQTGWGNEVWAAAQYLIAQNGNGSSPFYQKLNTGRVGAAGHSQGATGATNATVLSNGVIKSTVALALVDPFWHSSPDQIPRFGQLRNPIFFVSGANDFLTSQSSQQNYFNQAGGPAAKGALVGKDHSTMEPASLGYATAWFKYTLEGDTYARGAFVGNPPELNVNPNWTNQAEKGLT